MTGDILAIVFALAMTGIGSYLGSRYFGEKGKPVEFSEEDNLESDICPTGYSHPFGVGYRQPFAGGFISTNEKD